MVTGYKKHMFNFLDFKKFHNEKLKTTNMVHSLIKADKWLKKYDCLVTYGDIIFTDTSLKKNQSKQYKLLHMILIGKNYGKKI